MLAAHLAASQLAEVRFEILPNDGVDGNKAEHASFPYTALRVIITLQSTVKEILLLELLEKAEQPT